MDSSVIVHLIFLLSVFLCVDCEYIPVSKKSQVNHYLDLGCTPLPDAETTKAYSCLFESLENPIDKCTYKGMFINIGETIPDSGCHFGCTCEENRYDGQSGFTCAVASCYEPENATCITQHTLDGCCSSAQICDPEIIQNLYKCQVGSVTYLEGEQFRAEGSCKKCVCSEGFSGVREPPYCKIIECGVEKLNMDKIYSRCAPIYYQGASCCPDGWECYDSTMHNIMRNESRDGSSEYQCTFGNEKLDIGDMITSQDPCLMCSCDYPPLVTCTRRKRCIEWEADPE